MKFSRVLIEGGLKLIDNIKMAEAAGSIPEASNSTEMGVIHSAFRDKRAIFFIL